MFVVSSLSGAPCPVRPSTERSRPTPLHAGMQAKRSKPTSTLQSHATTTIVHVTLRDAGIASLACDRRPPSIRCARIPDRVFHRCANSSSCATAASARAAQACPPNLREAATAGATVLYMRIPAGEVASAANHNCSSALALSRTRRYSEACIGAYCASGVSRT